MRPVRYLPVPEYVVPATCYIQKEYGGRSWQCDDSEMEYHAALSYNCGRCGMISDYAILWKFLIIQFRLLIKDWIRPTNLSLIAGTYSDLTRSRTDLIVENALLVNRGSSSISK